MDNRNVNYPNVKYVEVDFGEVEVGVTKIKSIKIFNQCNVRQSYVVQRDPTSNPLDCVFHIVDYNWSLEPCHSYICDISYRPILPNRKYVDYLFVTDTYDCCYEILVRGNSLGPDVVVSSDRLILVCESEACVPRKSFKLTNRSSFPAKFMFDVDSIQCPFKISQASGVVKAASSKILTVSFEPNSSAGTHKYNLTCLVLNQEPLVIELYGICGCKLDKKYIQSITSTIEDVERPLVANKFTNYMSDVTTAIKNDLPPVSLSHSFLDFGAVQIGLENYGKRPPQTISLTNHTNSSLFVLWDKDVTEVFTVQPREAKMLGKQSIIFEIRFDPRDELTFHSRELIARVFRLPCCPKLVKSYDQLLLNVIPDLVSVRLIGHTYGKNANNWMPQYEIPETIVMPACVPGAPVYTTFVIRNFGKQPLMFSFVPPDTCHYSVKPMMGLVTSEQEQQVIAVQLFAESEGSHAYVERWACRLNGNPDNEVYIDLHGYAEPPNLIFGVENHVIFDPVHVDCRESLSVPVRNSTRHSARFELSTYNFPKELCIKDTSGVIDPNEVAFYDWCFMPDQSKAYNFGITCHLTTEMGDRNFDIDIGVSGTSVEGSLIAIPEDLDFGVREYEESGEMQFKLFNFSPVTINFLLLWRATKTLDGSTNTTEDIKISPTRGSIRPGKSEQIQVIVCPSHPGRQEIIIEYLTRACASDEDPIPSSPSKYLCKLFYTCYLATLQIKDLLYEAESNKNLSKVSLWKSLGIDNLNCILKNLMPCEEASVEMALPFDHLNENERFVIKLLIVNVNPVKASYSFKKKRNCFCNDQPIKKTSPFTKCSSINECSNCVLDHSCEIFPENVTLMPHAKCILSIEVKNNFLASSGLFWDLSIGQKRSITLNINLESPVISSGRYLKFKNVFVGQCNNAYYEAFWLYNNEDSESTYAVDIKNLVLYNKKNYGVIFTCLNPAGSIRGRDRKAVLIGFCPNRIGNFQVTVSVKIDERESLLKIEAESTGTNTPIVTSCETCPSSYTFLSPDILVYFNNDCIIMPPLPTYGKESKIVMVHNHHQLDVLRYQWENYEIPGVMKVTVEPASGLIQAQSLLTFIVEVIAGKYTCSLDVDVFCNFMNVSERRLAEKKKAQRDSALKQLEDEFTITEKGISYPKKPDFEETKVPSTFCKTLTLKIDVYNPRDADEKVQLEQHLKSMPGKEIMQEMMPCRNTFPTKSIKLFTQVIECMMWDILNSKSFARTLRNDLTKVHNLKYSQLPTDVVERKNQNERSSRVPPKQYVEDILQDMICMIVHEEFNLSTDHFSHPVDARQISYQKVYLEAHHQKVEFQSVISHI